DPPKKGSQYMLVALTMKYIGGGSSDAGSIARQLSVVGKHGVSYAVGDAVCAVRHDLSDGQIVFSGQRVSGNICVVIASNDASTLRMYLGQSIYDPSLRAAPAPGDIWFSLK